MSNIIKGQRIRNESTLKIKSEDIYDAPKEEDINLANDLKEQQEDIKREIQKAKSKAQLIMDKATAEARVKADDIIKEGQARNIIECQLALEKAGEEGYSKGYEKGQLEAQILVEEGKQIILDAKAQRQQILDEIEPEIIEMVIGICGKLLDEEINFSKDTILVLIRKALREVTGDVPEIIIKVPVSQYDYVLENKELISNNATTSENIEIREDSNLEDGSCVIETAFGSIECNINESFSEIKKQMRLIYNKK